MRRVFGILAVAAMVTAGCAKSNKVVTHPIRGQVFYEGRPAAGVQVFLFPVVAPGVPDIPANPHGQTGPDGAFSIGTYAEADGAAEGSYQVVLLWPEESSEGHESKQDRLLGWYAVARSKLTATVPAGGVELPPIKLPAMKVPPSESGGGIQGRN
jgi:hypothetical protein